MKKKWRFKIIAFVGVFSGLLMAQNHIFVNQAASRAGIKRTGMQASGNYFITLKQNNHSIVQTLVLIK